MINLDQFLSAIETIKSLSPKYRLGHTGDDGYCDCIGLVIGAVERCDAQTFGYTTRMVRCDNMAIIVVETAGTSNSPDRKVFMISDESDVNNLPTQDRDGIGIAGRAAPASIALTDDGKVFMLGTNDAWNQL